MSSEQYERHEEDYKSLYDDLKFKVEVKIPTCGGGKFTRSRAVLVLVMLVSD